MFCKERKVIFHFEISLDHWDHMTVSLHLLAQKGLLFTVLFLEF